MDGDTFYTSFLVKNKSRNEYFSITRKIRLLGFNFPEKDENNINNKKCIEIIKQFCDEEGMIYLYIKGFDIFGDKENNGRILAFAYNANYQIDITGINKNNLSFKLASERLGNVVKSSWYQINYIPNIK